MKLEKYFTGWKFRSMLTKKADSIIAYAKFDGSKEVRFIALLIFFVWGTFTLLNVVVLATDPSIPKDLLIVRQCKGTFGLTFYNNSIFKTLLLYEQDYYSPLKKLQCEK